MELLVSVVNRRLIVYSLELWFPTEKASIMATTMPVSTKSRPIIGRSTQHKLAQQRPDW